MSMAAGRLVRLSSARANEVGEENIAVRFDWITLQDRVDIQVFDAMFVFIDDLNVEAHIEQLFQEAAWIGACERQATWPELHDNFHVAIFAKQVLHSSEGHRFSALYIEFDEIDRAIKAGSEFIERNRFNFDVLSIICRFVDAVIAMIFVVAIEPKRRGAVADGLLKIDDIEVAVLRDILAKQREVIWIWFEGVDLALRANKLGELQCVIAYVGTNIEYGLARLD